VTSNKGFIDILSVKGTGDCTRFQSVWLNHVFVTFLGRKCS